MQRFPQNNGKTSETKKSVSLFCPVNSMPLLTVGGDPDGGRVRRRREAGRVTLILVVTHAGIAVDALPVAPAVVDARRANVHVIEAPTQGGGGWGT